MRWLLAIVALVGAGALAFPDRAEDGRPERVPPPISSPAATATSEAAPRDRLMLAALPRRRVAAVDPRTLRAVSPPARIAPVGGPVAVSPDGRLAAFGADRSAGVRILDLVRGRAGRSIALGGRGPVVGLVWTGPHRLAVFAGIDREGTDVYELDTRTRRLVGRRHIDGEVVAAAPRRGGAAALVAPPGRIGAARLLVLRLGAKDRLLPLRGLRAGFDRLHPEDGDDARARNLQPGLAVDPDDDVAYVVDAEYDRIARIELTAGRVELRRVTAQAAKSLDSRRRHAVWLGGGRLAVAGAHDGEHGTILPYGLRIVDTRTWRERVLDRRQTWPVVGAGRLLAWEGRDTSVAIYDRRGRLRHRVRLPGAVVYHATAAGRYAWMHTFDDDGEDHRMFVVDLIAGRVLDSARDGMTALAVTAAAEPPVLGVDFRRERVPLRPGVNFPRGAGTLARFDPLTLRRVSRGIAVRGFVFGWDTSPDGASAALGTGTHGRIRVVDVSAMRSRNGTRLPVREPVSYIRWAAPDRIVALTVLGHTVAWEIDPGHGAVKARHRLDGRPVAVERMPDGLVVLLGPRQGTGIARLALVRAGAPPRIVELAGVRAGFHRRESHDVPSDAPPDLIPGLAVGDGAAWIVDPQAFRVVRVELASSAATTHDVEVTARASKGGPVSERSARWLGGGLLAVSGLDGRDGFRPFGVRIVDAATWRARIVDEHANSLQTGAGALIYPRYERHRPPTLFAYEPDGRRRFSFRPRFGMSGVDIAGNYAYVRNGARRGGNHRTHVIDLRNGREVGTLRSTNLPILLARP